MSLGIAGVVATSVAAGLTEGGGEQLSLVSTTAPPGPLVPNSGGYVRIETKSGATKCSINTDLVACETSGDGWPVNSNGQHYHTVSVNASGEFHWVDANLGVLEGRVTIDYQNYSAQGWTIVGSPEYTKFTNDLSGHGMSVSDQRVTAF